MVGSQSQKLIDDALSAANQLFTASGELPNADSDFGISHLVKEAFEAEAARNQIRSIFDQPLSSFKTGELVKLEAIVLDVNFGEEIFVGAFRNEDGKWSSGRYTNKEEVSDLQDSNKVFLEKRMCMLCARIPGQRDLDTVEGITQQLETQSISDSDQKTFRMVCKWYCGQDNGVKVCDALRIIGLYEADPAGSEPVLNNTNDQRPAGTIHVLYHEDFFKSKVEKIRNIPTYDEHSILQRRSQVIRHFESIFRDRKAAELTLLSIISSVESRRSNHLVGKFVLNIQGCDGSIVQRIKGFLNSTCSPFVYQKITIDILNKVQLYPLSDGEKLTPGVLQIAQHTILLLDETELEEGQLNERGVRNFKFLSNLSDAQTIGFVFPFNEFQIETNVNILLLSKDKSLMPADLHYKLNTNEQKTNSIISSEPADPDDVNNYLLKCRFQTTDISESISEAIQKSYVEERKVNKSVGQYHLSRRITLAKLRARTLGRNKLEFEDYRQIMDHVPV